MGIRLGNVLPWLPPISFVPATCLRGSAGAGRGYSVEVWEICAALAASALLSGSRRHGAMQGTHFDETMFLGLTFSLGILMQGHMLISDWVCTASSLNSLKFHNYTVIDPQIYSLSSADWGSQGLGHSPRPLEEWSQAMSPLKPDCRLGLGSALCAQLGLAQGFWAGPGHHYK